MLRLLSVGVVLGLATFAAADEPKKETVTVVVVGMITCGEKDALSYRLTCGGKVIATEMGVGKLPGKAVEVPAKDVAGPLKLTLTAVGTVRVGSIGVSVKTQDGKTRTVRHPETPAVVLNFNGVTTKTFELDLEKESPVKPKEER